MALPVLPPAEPRFLVKPTDEAFSRCALRLQSYLQEVCASPELRRSAAVERFLDAVGRVPAARPHADGVGVPPALFYALQALLPQRLPLGSRVQIGRRCARAESSSFGLEVRLQRSQRLGGAAGLLLIAVAPHADAASAWLDELAALAHEVAASRCRQLRLASVPLPPRELQAFCAAGTGARDPGRAEASHADPPQTSSTKETAAASLAAEGAAAAAVAAEAVAAALGSMSTRSQSSSSQSLVSGRI